MEKFCKGSVVEINIQNSDRPFVDSHKNRHPDLAVFTPSFSGGGAERMLLTVAQELADRGYAVDLLVVSSFGPYRSEVRPPLNVVDLKAKGVLASLPKLVKYLRLHTPKVLFTGLGRCNLVAIWARALARKSLRVCISERNTLSISTAHSRSLRARITPFFAKHWYPKADAIVAISKGVAFDLVETLGLPQEKINVIYNPAVSNRIIEKSRDPSVHPWFLSNNSPVILSVGRLGPQKDYLTLIKAFSVLLARREARLIILGEGPLRKELAELAKKLGIADDIAFPGFVDNPFAYMRQADVFVLSSRWEGFGNVLAEAMACGTPVVSTNCPNGPAEILENGKWGRLVPVGDPDALASAIMETLDEPQHPDVEKRARDFSTDVIIDQYIKVLGLD
jgi:glycosyltransferase involved in cell wall biosynthesis